jgi:hypothetical protein
MIRYYYISSISSRSGSTDGSINHHHHRRRFLDQWLLPLRHHGTILEHTPSSNTQPNLPQGRGGVRKLETV